MEVVLLKDVKNVGRQWDVCTVSPGFARNVLIPNNDAAPATPEMLAKAERMRKTKETKRERVATGRSERASELDGMEITIIAKANEAGDLYAAVSPAQIAREIKKQGVTVSPKAIVIEQPVKSCGTHTLSAKLGGGAKAQFRVMVEAA